MKHWRERSETARRFSYLRQRMSQLMAKTVARTFVRSSRVRGLAISRRPHLTVPLCLSC